MQVMDIVNLVIAFNLGLFSTLHCLGMCGGIIGALSLGITADREKHFASRAGYVFAYNAGRILSYSAAGAIAGLLGGQIAPMVMPDYGHRILQFFAAGVLVLIGLHLAGWLPKLKFVESFGYRLWQYIQPAGRRFFPVDRIHKAFMIGILWGWLPCALVYSVLLWSLTSGGAFNGAILMFAFGLGTLPGMVTAGIMGNRLLDLLKHAQARIWAGVIVILFGIASPFLVTGHHDHQQQHHSHSHH
jgi:sulfite exporter TauE/SafE